MNDLYKALGDISSIRRAMANTTEFRGYGPATLAATGVFAMLAAVAQVRWVPDPAGHISAYLAIWIATALLSVALTGMQMYTRTRRLHSGLSNEMLRLAVEQFLPAAAAGLLVTIVFVRYVPSAIWMLPGMWQVIFSLGIFSSCRFLPRPMIAAAAWFLLTGCELARDGWRSRSVSVGDGNFFWSRPTSGCSIFAVQYAGGRR